MDMKNKILLVLSIITFVNCVNIDDRYREGFTFDFYNKLNSIDNATLYIGGIVGNNFIATDSIVLNEIKQGSSLYNTEDDRWKPSLDKIRILPSDSCYFIIKFNNREEILKTCCNATENFKLNISDSRKDFVNEEGKIFISIYQNQIIGGRHKGL